MTSLRSGRHVPIGPVKDVVLDDRYNESDCCLAADRFPGPGTVAVGEQAGTRLTREVIDARTMAVLGNAGPDATPGPDYSGRLGMVRAERAVR